MSAARGRARTEPPRVILSGRGIAVTPALKTLIEGKITRLARVLPDILDARVVCAAEKFRRSARITLRARRRTFASEATAGDLATALIEAADAIRRQARETKERRTVSKGRAPRRRGTPRSA